MDYRLQVCLVLLSMPAAVLQSNSTFDLPTPPHVCPVYYMFHISCVLWFEVEYNGQRLCPK